MGHNFFDLVQQAKCYRHKNKDFSSSLVEKLEYTDLIQCKKVIST